MSRVELALLQVSALLLALSGLAVAIARYLLPAPEDAFAVGRPWESWALAIHVLASPAFLFAVGLIFRRHALAKLRDPRSGSRRSGTTLVALLAPLAFSGYLIQVCTGERVRPWLGPVHLVVGVAYSIAYAAHACPALPRPALADLDAVARASSLDSIRQRRR